MVAYRESITKSVEKLDKKYVRQSGGRGQYGHVVINVSPNLPGKGYHFENKIVGGVIQRIYTFCRSRYPRSTKKWSNSWLSS